MLDECEGAATAHWRRFARQQCKDLMYTSWLWRDHTNRKSEQTVTVRTIDNQIRHWSGSGQCRVMGQRIMPHSTQTLHSPLICKRNPA